MPVAPMLGYVGVAKEAVKGTAVAATAIIPIRVNRTLKDIIAQLDDDGMRGSMVDGPYDQIAGPQYSTFDGGGPSFADTLPWWLLGTLGDVTTVAPRSVADAVTNATTTVTSATAAFTQKDIGAAITPSADFAAGTFIVAIVSATSIRISTAALTTGATKVLAFGPATVQAHSGSVKNSGDGQPTSLTLTDFYGLTGGTPARQAAGCQVEEVGLKFSGDGLFEYTVKLQGFPTVTVAKPTNTIGTVTPHPGWEMVADIAGAPSLVVVSGELSFKRATEAVMTADGTQAPYRVQQGGFNLSGKVSFIAEDDAEYIRYLNHTTPAVLFRWGHGTGAATVWTSVLMSKCNVKASAPKHDGNYMAWDNELQALWNPTDAGATGGVSPCRVGFGNLLAASTYQ